MLRVRSSADRNRASSSKGRTRCARELLDRCGVAGHFELVEGNVLRTLPAFLENFQEHSFAIVNIDVDLYEGTKVAMEQLFPRVVRNGIVILDDYEGFPAPSGRSTSTCWHTAARNDPEVPFRLVAVFHRQGIAATPEPVPTRHGAAGPRAGAHFTF
jgi:hypothetical protein